MKKAFKAVAVMALAVVAALTICACGGGTAPAESSSSSAESSAESSAGSQADSSDAVESSLTGSASSASEVNPAPKNAIVVYFSATGNTAQIAQYAADALGADIYEIVPEEPYTSEDLHYSDRTTRATVEQNNPSTRPAIKGPLPDMSKYDTVLLGYPIWWGMEPRIIDTFVEEVNLDGKFIAPFCTSGSNGISQSEDNLEKMTSADTDIEWMEGHRFAAGATPSEVSEWLTGIGLL